MSSPASTRSGEGGRPAAPEPWSHCQSHLNLAPLPHLSAGSFQKLFRSVQKSVHAEPALHCWAAARPWGFLLGKMRTVGKRGVRGSRGKTLPGKSTAQPMPLGSTATKYLETSFKA